MPGRAPSPRTAVAPRSRAEKVCLDIVVLADLAKRPIEGFSAGPADDSDLFNWDIMIMGPPGTP